MVQFGLTTHDNVSLDTLFEASGFLRKTLFKIFQCRKLFTNEINRSGRLYSRLRGMFDVLPHEIFEEIDPTFSRLLSFRCDIAVFDRFSSSGSVRYGSDIVR